MRPVSFVTLVLWTLTATAASAEAWTNPAGALGLSWGAPVEAVKQAFPGGRLRPEPTLTTAYTATITVDGIPLTVVFQFVSDRGLQGAMLRFPISRLGEMVTSFERQYGRAPIRRNAEWQWEGTEVRISIGAYPSVSASPTRPGAQNGLAWLRTKLLEETIAHAVATGLAKQPIPESPRGRDRKPDPAPGSKSLSYEEQLLRKIYWQLRYPATTAGVYLVSLAFQLTASGRATELQLSVDPPNPDIAESVRTAVGKAQPFPLPSSGASRPQGKPIALTLTVTIFP